MSSKLLVYRLHGVSILKQLQFEEYLLRKTTDNCFVFNTGVSKRSIVLGFSGKPKELLDVEAIVRSMNYPMDKIEVLRRFTGGGTVIVDPSTIFVSFIMNAKDVVPPCNPYPREIMRWTEEGVYTTVFQKLFNMARSDSETTFRLREHDYVTGEKKFGGNAQTITKDRWVHHTSFLWDYNHDNMSYLKMPKKTPEYRKERKHSDFLIPMREIIGRMVTLPTVKDESNEEEFDNTDDISVLITPQDFERLLLSELSNNYELEASDICSSVSKNQWNRLNFYGAHNFDKKVENSYQLARFPILHGIDESSIDKLLAESSEEFTPRSYEEDITKYI